MSVLIWLQPEDEYGLDFHLPVLGCQGCRGSKDPHFIGLSLYLLEHSWSSLIAEANDVYERFPWLFVWESQMELPTTRAIGPFTKNLRSPPYVKSKSLFCRFDEQPSTHSKFLGPFTKLLV